MQHVHCLQALNSDPAVCHQLDKPSVKGHAYKSTNPVHCKEDKHG